MATNVPQRESKPDVFLTAAKAAAGAIGVAAIAFGLWKVRDIVVLLLLALTFAAAMRPGVEWLHRKKVPEALAILSFFVVTLGIFVLFFWLAVPPAIHQLQQALSHPLVNGTTVHNSTGFRHDVLVWLNTHAHHLPSGTAIFHPITAYGHKATDAVVGVFFVTLVTVSVVGLIFGALAVVLAVPAVSAAETLIDVLVFGHDPPSAPPPRTLRPLRTRRQI